jgi:hypothetical protein
MLQPTVSRIVCPGVNIFTVRQLRICSCGAPSLTRGRAYRSQLLLALSSALILGSQSLGTHGPILLTQIPDFLNLWGQVPVFIFRRHQIPFSWPLTTHRVTMEVFERTSTRGFPQQSQSQSVMLGPTVSLSVFLEVKHPSRAQDQVFISQTVARPT